MIRDAMLLHATILATRQNAEGHPLLLGLWRAWCPVAAWWWRMGVRVPEEAARAPHPALQAVEDYAGGGTLRDHLRRYGLEKLVDDVRKYIDEVRLARQRLPHIPAPETLPTFPGGKIPLERRFGVQRALAVLGGDQGLLEYVRVWAFLIQDWKTGLPFAGVDLGRVSAALALEGVSALRLEVWAWIHRERPGVPYALFTLPGPDMWLAALWTVQSATRRPWPHLPQVWAGDLKGHIRPAQPRIAVKSLLAWWLQAGRDVTTWTRPPLPAAALDGRRCEMCPFRGVCFEEEGQTYHPVPQLLAVSAGGS